MFKKILLIGLVCIFLMAFMPSQASAGCCCNPRFCASWLTGSTLNSGKLLVKNIDGCLDEGSPDGDCGVFEIAGLPIYSEGSFFVNEACYNIDPYDKATWDKGDLCSSPVFQTCDNPDESRSNRKKDKDEDNFIPPGEPSAWIQGVITDIAALGIDDCSKNGQCRRLLELFLQGGCNRNWEPDSTFLDFVGYAADYPGGFTCPNGQYNGDPDVQGDETQCCADNQRNPDWSCVAVATVGDSPVACADNKRTDGECQELNPGSINGIGFYPGKPLIYLQRVTVPVDWQPGDAGPYAVADCEEPTPGTYSPDTGDPFQWRCDPAVVPPEF